MTALYFLGMSGVDIVAEFFGGLSCEVEGRQCVLEIGYSLRAVVCIFELWSVEEKQR
jgi:hypothetical protein